MRTLVLAVIVAVSGSACGEMRGVTAPSGATLRPSSANCNAQLNHSQVNILDQCKPEEER